MDDATRKKLGGTVTKLSVSYERKISDGNYGSVGGSFFVEADLAPDTDPDTSADALYEWVKAAATRNLKASMEAVKPREPSSVPQKPPETPPGPPVAKHAPQPSPAPVAPTTPQEGPDDRTLDVADDDTVQYKILDSGKKLLLFKVGPFKMHGVDCWPEVVQTWSEMGGWETWQPAQPFYVKDFGIRQVVISMKPSKKDPNKMTPDKVIAFR